MLAAAFGLAAALCWGLSDFIGGTQARRVTLATVIVFSQTTGLIAILIVAGIEGAAWPEDRSAIAWALIAGMCQLVGAAALYRGLAIGTMSVISPVTAGGAAVIPVIVGVSAGDELNPLQAVGVTSAIAGVFLACRPQPGASHSLTREALILLAIATLAFSGFFIGMDAAVDEAGPFAALAVARVGSFVPLILVILLVRPSVGFAPRQVPALAAVGLLDIGANTTYALGAETGQLSVVAVLASLYPVTTVVLAGVLLGERLSWLQAVGVGLALSGVALVTAP